MKKCNATKCTNEVKFAFKYVYGPGPIYKINLNYYCLDHMKEFKGQLGESFILMARLAKEGYQPRHNGYAVGPVFDNMFEAADFWNSLIETPGFDVMQKT